jgi:hypothetical protein
VGRSDDRRFRVVLRCIWDCRPPRTCPDGVHRMPVHGRHAVVRRPPTASLLQSRGDSCQWPGPSAQAASASSNRVASSTVARV